MWHRYLVGLYKLDGQFKGVLLPYFLESTMAI